MRVKIVMDSGIKYEADFSNDYREFEDLVADLIKKDVHFMKVANMHVAIRAEHISSIEKIY